MFQLVRINATTQRWNELALASQLDSALENQPDKDFQHSFLQLITQLIIKPIVWMSLFFYQFRNWRAYTRGRACTRCLPVAKGEPRNYVNWKQTFETRHVNFSCVIFPVISPVTEGIKSSQFICLQFKKLFCCTEIIAMLMS